MNLGQMVLVACALEVGGFSGERAFKLKLAGGTDEYSGIAPLHYCRTDEKSALPADQPPRGMSIPGFVEAFLVSNGGDQATVELPDGEAVRVDRARVLIRQDKVQEPAYVSIGS